MRRVESEQVTADAVLRDAMSCMFHNRNVSSLGDQEINERLNEYWSQDPIERPDGQQQEIPDFASLEDFGAQFGLTGEELRSLRDVLTAQPRRLLPAINVNTASVRGARRDPQPRGAVRAERRRYADPRAAGARSPIAATRSARVMSGVENATAKRGLLDVHSSLFRLEGERRRQLRSRATRRISAASAQTLQRRCPAQARPEAGRSPTRTFPAGL